VIKYEDNFDIVQDHHLVLNVIIICSTTAILKIIFYLRKFRWYGKLGKEHMFVNEIYIQKRIYQSKL